MRGPGSILNSRSLAVAVILAVTVLLVVVSLLPEGSFLLAEGADSGLPLRIALAVLLAVGALAMLLATIAQVRSLLKRSRSLLAPRASGREPSVDLAAIRALLTAQGWRERPVPDGSGAMFVRHAWSSWSGVVLHVGLLLALVGLAAVILTESRSEYVLQEGDRLDGLSEPSAQFVAPLASEWPLDGELVLDAVLPTYWPSGELRHFDSEFTDLATGDSITVSVNSVTRWSGARLFQSRVYGRVFNVRIAGAGLPDSSYRIEVESVPVLGEPGYRDLVVPGIEGTVRLRSIETMTAGGVVPFLAIRLERDGELLGQGELALGETVMVGGYEMTLDRYGYWQSIVLVRQHGVEAVVLGTILVMLGSIAFYLIPHVRVYVLEDADTHRVIVSGSRLARSAMKDRIDSIVKGCA